MAVPRRVDDGIFYEALAVGPAETSFPFADEGDLETFVVKQKYRQDALFYKQGVMMSPRPFTFSGSIPTGGTSSTNDYKPGVIHTMLARRPNTYHILGIGNVTNAYFSLGGNSYLVDEGPTRDIGSGILEWWRTYASLPKTRVTGSTISYTEQYGILNGEILELTRTYNCEIQWEYFLSPPPIEFAPKIVSFNNTFLYIGNWGARISGKHFLACDQERGLYRGKIYYRKSIYVDAALTFQGSPA